MAFIKLKIEEPIHDAVIVGAPVVVNFRGKVESLPEEASGIALYYRWYSSSVARIASDNTTIEGYSMNKAALGVPENPFPHALGMGSHVITFAVCDHPGETDDDFTSIRHGGVTGGRCSGRPGEHPCVIHVFKANILELTQGQVVSRAGLKLIAEAPSAWSDNSYHEINRLAYRWKLEPVGSPASRPEFDSNMLAREELTFNAELNMLPTVSYTDTPMLPPSATGQYRISLFVVDKNDPVIGQHQDTRTVTLT